MPNILCLNNISPVGLNALPKNYSITTELAQADAILVRSALMLEMALPKTVIAVARAGAGVNNIPLDNYAKAGVVVFNTPGANANAVKELTIAGMLLASRDIYGGMKWVQENKADKEIGKTMEKAKAQFAGTEIMGKNIGIIGLGAVGSMIAQSAGLLGMKVIGYEVSPEVIQKNKEIFPKNIVLVPTLDELYAKADFISLNIPLLPATKGMINKDSIAKMKPGVVVLNIARDAIVNDADMRIALETGKVRKYVTDFPTYESANIPGVIAMPHLGASTEEAEDNCAFMAANQIVDYLENGNITNGVNFPNIDGGKLADKGRVVILHENIDGLAPMIVNQVENHCKISQSISKTRGDFAVTLIDFNHPCADCLAKKVADMTGVIRIRVIK